MDPAEAVMALSRAGLEVFAGFIVGFDGDDAGALQRQREFVSKLPIPRAMVGILTALPGTQLWRRLEREGRLRGMSSGDQFDRTNFVTTMPERDLVAGYRELMAALFDPDAFFSRCEQSLRVTPSRPGPVTQGAARIFLRAVWRIGIRGEARRRRWFWRLLRIGLSLGFPATVRAISFSIIGEHFVRYTEEEVLPRLERRLAEIDREAAQGRAIAAASGAGARERIAAGPQA
jgi:hypothetical protein